jgi:hypothetical protein
MADGGLVTLRERVEQAISGSGEIVVARVVDAFVETEIKRRADILTAGVNTMRQLEIDLRKIKPDVVHVDENGAQVASHYTVNKQKELQNHRQKMANLDGAISAVLEKPDDADSWNKLDQAIKKASSKGGGSDKGGDSTDE